MYSLGSADPEKGALGWRAAPRGYLQCVHATAQEDLGDGWGVIFGWGWGGVCLGDYCTVVICAYICTVCMHLCIIVL